MISLEELSKINNLIASCNDMIEGKFILADYKIANILKNITESKEVYDLIAKCMNGFSFEREFSRAQIRGSGGANKSKMVLPAQPEKILPFVFCVLVNLNNKNIDFAMFLNEFYSDEKGKNFEFANFAKEVIMPFRDIIANYFDISVEQASKINNKNINTQIEEGLDDKIEEEQEEFQRDEIEEEFEEEINFEEENQDVNLDAEKIENFFDNVKNTILQLKNELSYDRRLTEMRKEEITYLADVIIQDCEAKDLNNVVALLTAFHYVIYKVKILKFLTKELQKLLINLYN